jgi:hypothetical protein
MGIGTAFPTHLKSGVLDVALHTARDTSVFSGHEQFVDLFHAIGSDSDIRVVTLTGSGDAFIEAISPEGFMSGKNNEVMMTEASGLVGVAASELMRN